MKTFAVFFAKLQRVISKIALVLSLAHALFPKLSQEMPPLVEPHVTSSKWLEIRQREGEAVLELSCDLSGTGVTQVTGLEFMVRQQWLTDGGLDFEILTSGSWLFEDVVPVQSLQNEGDWGRLRLTLPDGAYTIGSGRLLLLDFQASLPSGFDLNELIKQLKPGGIVILDDVIL